MRPQDDPEEGMMLAEVLVGLAILSLATLAMFRTFAGATSAIGQVDRASQRYDIAENLLSRYVADGVKVAGEEGGQNGDIGWWVETVPVADKTAAPGKLAAYRILIRIGSHDAKPLLTSVVYGATP